MTSVSFSGSLGLSGDNSKPWHKPGELFYWKIYRYFERMLNLCEPVYVWQEFLKYLICSQAHCPPPTPLWDKFCKVWKMIFCVDLSHSKVFILYWILRLYKFMSIWMNKFTCSGFIIFPYKPYKKGNEYQTIYWWKWYHIWLVDCWWKRLYNSNGETWIWYNS